MLLRVWKLKIAVRARVRACVHAPDEVAAVGAVGGLPQVRGHELVPVDLVDAAANGALPLPGAHPLAEHPLLIVSGAGGSWGWGGLGR